MSMSDMQKAIQRAEAAESMLAGAQAENEMLRAKCAELADQVERLSSELIDLNDMDNDVSDEGNGGDTHDLYNKLMGRKSGTKPPKEVEKTRDRTAAEKAAESRSMTEFAEYARKHGLGPEDIENILSGMGRSGAGGRLPSFVPPAPADTKIVVQVNDRFDRNTIEISVSVDGGVVGHAELEPEQIYLLKMEPRESYTRRLADMSKHIAGVMGKVGAFEPNPRMLDMVADKVASRLHKYLGRGNAI